MLTTEKELDRLFYAQKEAFLKNSMPSLEERIDRLKRLEAAMVKNRIGFQKTLREDFGAHHSFVTDLFETGGVIGRSRYIQAMLADWMKPSPRELDPAAHGGSKAQVIRQPKGVIGNMAPWNFPIECALVMVNDMLGAGNRVIVKASRQTPATSALMQQAISAEFDETELAVVCGDHVSFAEYFCTLPWNHLTYTGGGEVAKGILRHAAENLTQVTLELGGKNPTLFTQEGVCELLVERFLYNRVFKGGQVCTSPDYALVPEGRVDEWVTLAKKTWTGMYPTYVGHADATGTINRRHYDRLLGYLDEARKAGCDVISLNGEEPNPDTLQIPMYVVVEPDESLDVMKDEMFGPITAVKSYKSFDDAVDYINRRDRPLAAYIVGRERDLIEKFQTRVLSGGVGVNVFGLQGAHPALPFGGTGASGMGCHSGFEGFLTYTHNKSVFECADDSLVMASLKGPYGELAQAVADSIFATS
ncbi:MAG TPA: aldehyde dehydrogenase family protein [Parvularculaceae bacterium]|nr:aldehyde dehydrogenase family protein [Amphiplicatus sp.]MCB9956790.1 aldehyde dehydrogenase family protein [Caulobacterales bacterium]HPE31378.1 aldehyde dehydrogenase family protein [Parvularculaceae bacterium]HRX38339.1 aldehyde dehydrogenase family protein [Parvularculaceae bacterium]